MPRNELREYLTWEDLTASCDNNQIIRWVNELASKKEKQKKAHRKYNETTKALVRVARELLDRSEIEVIEGEKPLFKEASRD